MKNHYRFELLLPLILLIMSTLACNVSGPIPEPTPQNVSPAESTTEPANLIESTTEPELRLHLYQLPSEVLLMSVLNKNQ